MFLFVRVNSGWYASITRRFSHPSKKDYTITMKYLLTSSGLRNDAIADALSSLLQKPLSETDILFVPTAANTDGGDKRWLIENLKDFERYNFKSIDILNHRHSNEENSAASDDPNNIVNDDYLKCSTKIVNLPKFDYRNYDLHFV